MTADRKKAIVARYRKVSWGRLLWKKSNPTMRVFDRDDVCVVRNGGVTIHYKSIEALLEQIAEAERDRKRLAVKFSA